MEAQVKTPELPGVWRFILCWAGAIFAFSLLFIPILGLLLAPMLGEEPDIIVSVMLGIFMGCFSLVFYVPPGAALIGAAHYALRGTMLKALAPPGYGQEPKLTLYYLLNLLFGCAASLLALACGTVGMLAAGEITGSMIALGIGVIVIGFGLCGLAVGEVLRPKFERYIAYTGVGAKSG